MHHDVYELRKFYYTRALGRVVQKVRTANLSVGTQRIELPVRDLNPGIYFLRLQQGAMQEVGRFVVR